MNFNRTISQIECGKCSLGIELGSTRIKSVLIDETNNPISVGTYDWENQFVDEFWTYDLDEVWKGIQESYKEIKEDVFKRYKLKIESIRSFGVSAMMHGYLVFDKQDNLLVPFRTWRNGNTTESSLFLSEKFDFNIPERWSISHLYQSYLNKESHIEKINFMTTLSGYVHWQLTGNKILGIGDASGMFPIDIKTLEYEEEMIKKFSDFVNYSINIKEILPEIKLAGDEAGTISEERALLIDPAGDLKGGILTCPPEGDAGTGMVATNSVKKGVGNISVGTSVFAMIVLEERIKGYYTEVDMVLTPDGKEVAMIHGNNCTTEINSWVSLFFEFSQLIGSDITKGELFYKLFNLSEKGEINNIISIGYHSGENITNVKRGYPLLVRSPESELSVSNLMKVQLYGALATMSLGMDILRKENVKLTEIHGHGGFFKTPNVGHKVVSSALEAPVVTTSNSGEGGAWGIAVLANYSSSESKYSLEEYLEKEVFGMEDYERVMASDNQIREYKEFMKMYNKGVQIEKHIEKIF